MHLRFIFVDPGPPGPNLVPVLVDCSGHTLVTKNLFSSFRVKVYFNQHGKGYIFKKSYCVYTEVCPSRTKIII